MVALFRERPEVEAHVNLVFRPAGSSPDTPELNGRYELLSTEVDGSATAGEVRYGQVPHSAELFPVAEIHSHHRMGAFFSATDDDNEQRSGAYGVIGRLDLPLPHAAFRYSCGGLFEAMVLAERLGAAYGLEISAHPRYLDADTDVTALVPEAGIAVGCVDNAPTRKLLHERLSAYNDVVYLDAGNAGVPLPAGPGAPTRHERIAAREGGWEGQVVCGVRRAGETIMPFPADVFPDLVQGDEPLPSEAACGQVVQSLPQRHQTNLFAATVLMGFLTTLLVEGSLMHSVSFFDARQCYVRSTPAIDVLEDVRA